ncbi:hypothetical protein [Croceicoccus naphthovorans]|nr:hypothetical protein [Croceicoccus naphthovorans]MBB3991557.1 type VI protein secretion system component VasK [Croceicoccus naphthovorans]
MDLGFGSLVEKFEEHFGRWPTRVMLAVIGLAAMTVCVRLIILDAIVPIVQFILGAGGQSALELIVSVLAVAAGAAFSAFVAGGIFRWFVTRKVDVIIAKAQEQVARSYAIMEEASSAVAEVRASHEELQELFSQSSERGTEGEDGGGVRS